MEQDWLVHCDGTVEGLGAGQKGTAAGGKDGGGARGECKYIEGMGEVVL